MKPYTICECVDGFSVTYATRSVNAWRSGFMRRADGWTRELVEMAVDALLLTRPGTR